MSLLGVRLTLLMGPTVALPAPVSVVQALQGVEVTHDDTGRSGFQLTLSVGRSGPLDMMEYGLLASPLLKPMNRVVLVITFGVMPQVLFDGLITHRKLTPSTEPGASTLTLTGEDVSVAMDMEEKIHEHPAQVEPIIVPQLVAAYAKYQILPTVLPPPVLDVPLPISRIPVFRGTDYAYLRAMAARYGYHCYVTAGPLPMMNRLYWGPPQRLGVPQRALSVNMGGQSNVDSLDFSYNALSPTTVKGKAFVMGRAMPVKTFSGLRMPPLAPMPALVAQGKVRQELLNEADGWGYVAAAARAQGRTDVSMDEVLTVSGELDTGRYGGLLHTRGVVGVRGVGLTHDGLYYVKRVTHSIRLGEYKQRFTLTREGLGPLTPVVVP